MHRESRLRERKNRTLKNHEIVNVNDDEDDKSKSRKKVERKGFLYRCCVVTFIVLFLLSLCIYPGDAFIKDVLKYTGFMISGTGISHVSGISLHYLPSTSYEDGPIVISPFEIRERAESPSWEHCLLIFHDNNNTITLKRTQDDWYRNYDELDDDEMKMSGCTHFLATPLKRFRDADLTLVTAVTHHVDIFRTSIKNHAHYCNSNGCNFILSLVDSKKLLGRSSKFSKYFAVYDVMNTAIQEDKIVCMMDADAFFANWTSYKNVLMRGWPKEKDILVPSTEQVWINSGFMCLRNTEFATRFMLRVLNALYSRTDRIGFIRDQPALWYVMASVWKEEGLLDAFKGERCEFWTQCNPKKGPMECWHHCYFKPLASVSPDSVSSFSLPSVVNRVLSHVYIPLSNHIHRICVTSCRNAFTHFLIGICSQMISKDTTCYPSNMDDKLSLCSSRECIKQLLIDGGSWIMHTGFHHWHDDVFPCIPQSEQDANSFNLDRC